MSSQIFQKEDWLNRMYRKSESTKTRKVAITSLNMFELFCKNEGFKESEMIENYQNYFKESDIDSICNSLDKFVQFLNEDHKEIELNEGRGLRYFRKKTSKTIRTYFSFVKSYLRICYGIRISSEDIKDYVTFPKIRKEQRRAISIGTLKRIFNESSPERRALYYTLISSGMRIGECLALRKQNFHLEENPVKITLEAEITKTKEGRETFISREAFEKLEPLFEGKKDMDRIFTTLDDIDTAVNYEEMYFQRLRKRLNLLEKYPNSTRFVVNLHSFRAYFHTKASQKHGSDYANALDGHGAYLKQYYRETPEERARRYKELEPSLFIETIEVESKTKEKIIETLQNEMKKLQDEMTRIKLLNKV